MKVILATHNRYLEDGLCSLLQGYRVILAREFFMPENRHHIPEHNESWLIICDGQLRRLMRSLFHGRHFLQLDAESVKSAADINDAVRNGLWTWNTAARALTMSEMVVMFGYIYRQLRPCRLSTEMGVNQKTVNTFLYTGLAKNGLDGSSVRLLAINNESHESLNNGSSGAGDIRQ
ncbi:hypothetical protein [Escherichia coli]|uniref:hypothetical protein n=1 Tax=Escherichia coli TaxID=562 RepID=UPI000E20A240|nr:hypothetical protein [Escherichia coli]EEV8846451.1 hypothetical protein [Escherichia coli]EHY5882024.1 hypothetical protein [Escherichia coli]MBF5694411.1 hypothetical protein [Escherichia coli]RNI68959.1 hypothetical protein EFV16_14395 [Escherichia coli]RNJ16214.1 hypothetical protein EFV06_14105 [Escherichia coli]